MYRCDLCSHIQFPSTEKLGTIPFTCSFHYISCPSTTHEAHGAITDCKTQTWYCPLDRASHLYWSPLSQQGLELPGWVPGSRGLPSKSPVQGRTGPVEEHSSSALPPTLVAKDKAHARLKSHRWHLANGLPLAYLAWNRKYIFLLFILLTSGIN